MAITTANAKASEVRYCQRCQRRMPRRAARRQPKVICSACVKQERWVRENIVPTGYVDVSTYIIA